MAWNMEPLKEHIVDEKSDGIYEITAPPMRYKEYVIIGEEKSALIDTGFGWGNIREIVSDITDKPLVVINTHGHPDHCGGNAWFEESLMNYADLELLHGKGSYESRVLEAGFWHIPGYVEMIREDGTDPIHAEDGREIDLGGRILKIMYTPGHTRGSITVLDSLSGAAFTGDNVLAFGAMLIEPSAASLTDYLNSLRIIKDLKPSVLYSGHMPGAVLPVQIDKMIKLTERVLAGEEGVPFKNPMGEGLRLECEGTALTYNPEYVF